MEKRYQIFVSSTFNDLRDERRMVFDAIIRKKCFPVGMEWFPSLSRDSLGYIQEIIRDSDFFLLLVGGRYGDSVDENGTSFTELEYRYAIEKGIPVIPFIMSDWRRAPQLDSEIAKTKKLADFIDSVKETFDGWKPWTREDLKILVSEAIDQAKKDHPEAVGWVRGDSLPIDADGVVIDANRLQVSSDVFINGHPAVFLAQTPSKKRYIETDQGLLELP